MAHEQDLEVEMCEVDLISQSVTYLEHEVHEKEFQRKRSENGIETSVCVGGEDFESQIRVFSCLLRSPLVHWHETGILLVKLKMEGSKHIHNN